MTTRHFTPAEFKLLREAAGLTREEFAEHCGATQKTVKEWERPKARIPVEVGRDLLAILGRINVLADRLQGLQARVLPLPRPIDQPTPFSEGYRANEWSQAIVRCLMLNPEQRVMWLDADAYRDHLAAAGLQHSLAEMARWAEQAHDARAAALPNSP